MRITWMLSLFVSAALAGPALASMGGGGSPPSIPASSPDLNPSGQPTPRQQAERDYGDAYSEIAKARKDVAAGKGKTTAKRFQKALDRARHAVELDSTYHEAWNLVGYASRKLGMYDDAVAAYVKCLGIQYDYAPAREYLGEAYVEMGKLDKAREQLAALERLKATDESAELKGVIDTYVAAHPDAAAPATDAAAGSAPVTQTTAAPADSTATK
jgi:tetratricopeptide (TPR) repeat protein